MFTCNVCLHRALKSLSVGSASGPVSSDIKGLLETLSSLSSQVHIPRKRPRLTRSHATLASLKKGHHRRDLNNLNKGSKHKLSPIGDKRRKEPWPLTKPEKRDAVARQRNRAAISEPQAVGRIEDVIEPGKQLPRQDHKTHRAQATETKRADHQDPAASKETKLVRRAEKEVETYLMDPLQLANQVLNRLRTSDFDAAMRLIFASEKFEIKNIVSWNHCIDWLMAHGEVKRALKLYNDMKKRGHMPDSYTYTLLLRGLSENISSTAAQEATKIYGSILAPNSTVTLNTIHTNAVINVCARAGDLDALWTVVSRLPDKGAGSPDKVTYTTILHALRENAIRAVARRLDATKPQINELDPESERQNLLSEVVKQGRSLWEDISRRWRRADMQIDEALVCAMGRLLHSCGTMHDQHQIFDLITSTMNLRLAGEKGKHLRAIAAQNNLDIVQVKNKSMESSAMNDNTDPLEGPRTNDMHTGSHKDMPEGEDNPEQALISYRPKQASLPLQEAQIFAAPGSKTLALLMDACLQTKKFTHLAPAYWDLLTNPTGKYRIQPDPAHIIAYLRNLRVNRSSSEAYRVLAHPWPKDLASFLYRRPAFVLAMSTCLRDKFNPNVFVTAQKLMKLMQEKTEEIDLGMYDGRKPLGEMNGKERHEFLLKQRQEVKHMSAEERAEFDRSREGVQSLPLDPKVLTYYLDLAVKTTKGDNEGVLGKDTGEMFERDPKKNHIMLALQQLKPITMQLQALVKRKIEELEQGKYQRESTKGRKAIVPLSQVGEDLEELLRLMRTMVSAFDKVVHVSERVSRIPGKEKVDERLIAEYDRRKREYTLYMMRIEKATGISAKSQISEEQMEDKDDASGEQDIALPEIERRIKMVLGEVDDSIMDGRAEKKGFKSPFFASSQRDTKPIKIHSRIQKAERDTLRERALQRHFPQEDYGVLNENLLIETGKDAQRAINLRDTSKQATTFDVFGNRADSTEAVAAMSTAQRRQYLQDIDRARNVRTKSKQKRKPMIGDELGLDDDEDDEDEDDQNHAEDIRRQLGAVQVHEDIPFEPRITKTSEPWRRSNNSILLRDDVRGAWHRSATVATG